MSKDRTRFSFPLSARQRARLLSGEPIPRSTLRRWRRRLKRFLALLDKLVD